MKNTPVGPVAWFSGEPERDRSRKTEKNCRALDTGGGGAMLNCDELRAWSVYRLDPYGKSRLIVLLLLAGVRVIGLHRRAAMRRLLLGGVALALLFTGAGVLLHEGSDLSTEEASRIASLISQLGDEKFARREVATRELQTIGVRALPMLRKAAAESDDVEIRWRANAIYSPPVLQSTATGMELVLVRAGEFDMGSPESEQNRKADETQHPVRFSEPFYLGAYEVTQHEFEIVMGHNPSWFAASGGGKAKVEEKETRRYPVETISWFDTVDFCNRLSEREGFELYYRLSNVEREEKSIQRATVAIAGGHGYRLPTEAEWEFACRARTQEPYSYGGDSNARLANTKGVSVSGGYGGAIPAIDLGRPTVVGSYKPNPWGLFDMHGNASEWVWDWYDADYYLNAPNADPRGPERGKHRVLRGGSWLVNEGSCRSASRFWQTPDEAKNYAGFRVCRTP